MPRYKYSQESGTDFKVVSPDKADAQEDANEVRQILDDLGNLLGHSKRNDLYPGDGTTGGILTIPHTVIIIADGDTTPDVSDGTIFITSANTEATEITDLDNPTVGQVVTLIGGSDTNPSTISDTGNFKLSAAMTLGLDDIITFFVKADNYYIELSRSIN
jgi:hypothetical protein